jgi:Patatin-like phospholipase
VSTPRIFVGFAVGLVACALLVSSLPPGDGSAHAQKLAEVKKKAGKKGAPKGSGQQQETRALFTLEEQDAAVVPGFTNVRAWGDSPSDFARLLPQASGPWLAISGGGSDGAFGGGVLTGWSQAGNRPEFAVVTGVSIGALIAPYAFLGSSYDEELRRSFTTITAADVFEDRMTRESLFDYWPLRRLIEQRVNAKLLSDIAVEHRRGRRLLVATTNLDAGRRVVWNMGAIAERGDDKALKLFREVLLASCSIPGFFSPVAIDVEANGKQFQEMHGDGTITAPFFVVPEAMFAVSSTALRPPVGQLYVIVNSKLAPDFRMTDRTIAGVLGRSIDVALTSALRAEIMLVQAGAQRLGIGLRVAYVDPAFNFPSRGPFDGKYMQALFDFGVEHGKKGTAFGDMLPDLSLRGSNDPR